MWRECPKLIVRNEDIVVELARRVDQRVLRWFGYVERKDEYRIRLARRVLMEEESGGRVRGRPRLGWMNGVKVALGNRGMTLEVERQCVKNVEKWRARVHISTIEYDAARLLGFLIL